MPRISTPIFVGCGAPRGRDLDIPGRKEAAKNIHIGIDWLSSVSFGHIDKIGKRVIVLGGGNTAMDCCRSSRRLGGEDVKVIVRSGFEEMKASPWEKEDAMHEDIPIFNYLVPKEFTHDNGKLTGVVFEKVKAVRDAKGRRNLVPTGEPDEHFPCDDVLVAVGQENAFPWIERDCGIEFDKWDMPKVDPKTMASTNPKVFFGGDAAFGPKNIIWAVAHGHEAAISIDRFCRGEDVNVRPAPQVAVSSQKMGIHEWSYDNEITLDKRYRVPHREKVVALRDIKAEVELGYDVELALKEAERCLNCDVQTVFTGQLCIECDACVDICPMDCITFTANGEEADLRARLQAPAKNLDPGPLYRQQPQDRPRHGEGRGRLPALRPVRRALSHRRLGHAEIPDRHDSRGTSMPIQSVNDFVVRFANVNGSGSASANELFARVHPAHGRAGRAAQHLPVEHPGPADLVRSAHFGSRPSRRPRRHRPDGGDEPADLGQGRRRRSSPAAICSTIRPSRCRSRNSATTSPSSACRSPRSPIATYTDPRQRQLFKNIIYLGALSALLDMDPKVIEKLIGEQYKGKEKLLSSNVHALHLGRDWALHEPEMPDRAARAEAPTRSATAFSSKAIRRRRSARSMAAPRSAPGIRSRRRRRSPTPSPAIAGGCAIDPETKKNEIRHRPGRGRAGFDRHRDRRRLERRPRLYRDLRARAFR